jgi:hypothetical protein
MKVTTGQMQDTTKFSLVNITIDKHGNKSSTYNINESSGIGIHDSIDLTLDDTTTNNRTNMKQVAYRNNDYETYMKNSRQIASLQNNQFSSVFNLQQDDNNIHIDSDIFCIDEVSKNHPLYSCLPVSEHQHGNHITEDNDENSSQSSIESRCTDLVPFNHDNNDPLDMNDIQNNVVGTGHMLEATTHKCTRTTGLLARRFKTDQAQLQYKQFKKQFGTFYTDYLKSNIKLVQGHIGGTIYKNKLGFMKFFHAQMRKVHLLLLASILS